jgi:hypothetical protein
MLGDGTITNTGVFEICQTLTDHQHYFIYLCKIYMSVISSTYYYLSKSKTYHGYIYITHSFCKENEKKWYIKLKENKRRKIVPTSIQNEFDVFSLITWICDDGSMNGGVKLATHSFSNNDILILRKLLQKRLGLKTNVHKDSGKDTIYIFKESMQTLYKDIEHVFPLSMLYKVNGNFSIQDCKQRYKNEPIEMFREKNLVHSRIIRNDIECKICGIFLVSFQKMTKHRTLQKACNQLPKFKCDICFLTFNLKSLLSFHKNKSHNSIMLSSC